MNQGADLLIAFMLVVVSCCSCSKCPPEEELKPHCWCLESSDAGAVYCKDFNSPPEVVAPIEACQGYNVSRLGIFNSTLLYLPRDVFRGTSFQKISLFNTVLMSLSNGPLAFEGLEDTMIELRASRTQYVTQWRLSQLRQIKKMQLIDINYIHMEAIEDFPEFPNLTALGLVHAGITFLGDDTFAMCPSLQILDMRHNYISELKRSMLPKPANELAILNLEGNELSSFPEDFFTEMPSLAQVLLSKNQFTTIAEVSFGKIFPQINTLDLRGNSIKCDCRLKWILRSEQPHWFDGMCDQPPSMQGILLRMISTRNLYCY